VWKYGNDYAITSLFKLFKVLAYTHLIEQVCHAELFVSQSGSVQPDNNPVMSRQLQQPSDCTASSIHIFSTRRIARAVLMSTLCLSVCPSVCHMPALWQKSADTFWPQQCLVGDIPFRTKFRHNFQRTLTLADFPSTAPTVRAIENVQLDYNH